MAVQLWSQHPTSAWGKSPEEPGVAAQEPNPPHPRAVFPSYKWKQHQAKATSCKIKKYELAASKHRGTEHNVDAEP